MGDRFQNSATDNIMVREDRILSLALSFRLSPALCKRLQSRPTTSTICKEEEEGEIVCVCKERFVRYRVFFVDMKDRYRPLKTQK